MSPIADRLVTESLHRPIESFKRRQGKQIRRSMVGICYEMAGGRGGLVGVIADAIESLHAGSLVIDDVQDDSRLRRGEATLHQLIGVPLAINAGNWMYFRALELLTCAELPEAERSQLVSAMVRAGRRCHEGQAIDLHARVDRIPPADWKEIAEAISTLKTGVLVELAAQFGCSAANASNPIRSALGSFGCQIGVALQMRNDLDELARIAACRPTSNDLNGIRDDDLRHARITWPWAWAAELSSESRCQRLVNRLGRSAMDHHMVAVELLAITHKHGDQSIAAIVHEQVRLVGEHVLDPALLQRLRDHLQPIERATAVPAMIGRHTVCHAATLDNSAGARG